ncbi:MAG: hypothetical protein ABIR68_16235, partial [Ilumatobacteraceae bacterium]
LRVTGGPRRNRVDPWGDLHAVAERGLFTGNRGPLVDGAGDLVRHHASNLWITCVTSFRDWKHPLDQPQIWTPLFFLDDAVALAAGHRPCGFCRPEAYRAYRAGVTAWLGRATPVLAVELNRRLAAERLHRGRGNDRGADRRLWRTSIDELPDGTVVVGPAGEARVLVGERTLAFGFGGWSSPAARVDGLVDVLTPPTSVAALQRGFEPLLHPSAAVTG